MGAAARQNDMIKQDAPHCHAPIHPAAPVPTPVPHPALPLAIKSATAPTVKINGMAAAIVTSISDTCKLPSCVPAGPGMIAMGSMTVMICVLPAARVNDLTAHLSCVAPIPSPTGKVQSPCSTNVMIGG
jgi:uncharacterized Zn-binding protein involved in type VI secretion